MLDACDGSHSVIEYADRGAWDPARRQLSFTGQGHYACAKYLQYDEATNRWGAHQPPWSACWNDANPCIGHAYEHNTLDAQGNHYYRAFGSGNVHRYEKATGQWSMLPGLNESTQVAGALTYFPEMHGLVFVDSTAGIWLFDLEVNAWQQLSEPLPMGNYSGFAVYNPVHHVLWFGGGGGSTKNYVLDEHGAITELPDAPLGLGTSNGLTLTITADPVSGDYLVFRAVDAGPAFHVFDVVTRRWRLVSNDPSKIAVYSTQFWAIATPISTHGVVLFVTFEFDRSRVYLYRHASGSGDTDLTPPSAPTGLRCE
jgi:hypothetical protein